jgi:AraC family transcriptional regulator of adaptative response/methylated-DNA-[protein]-cysteine methyltransferase
MARNVSDEKQQESRDSRRIALACRVLAEADPRPGVAELAGRVGMSPHHFHRVFKRETGVTPGAYAESVRRELTRQALSEAASVTEAMYEAGYVSSGRFYEDSRRHLGMPPGRFRRGGEGLTIRFGLGRCSLGEILVAATDRGVCAISLGDDADRLLHDLQDRFPRAALIGGDREFEDWMAQVIGLVERPALHTDLPLDIHGTAFQQQVWQALREIPPGETASYADVARRIRRPTASRAVATACAANPLAVAIPCHRVVRQDGGLSGYRWGIERKASLLEWEQSSEK